MSHQSGKKKCYSDCVGMEFNICKSITVSNGKTILRNFIDSSVPYEVVEIAQDFGHQIMFTPPHYSDLQPIELLCARIKGGIGRILLQLL